MANARSLTRNSKVGRTVDCSANDQARATAIRATRKWGRIVFLGEGGRVEFNPSPNVIPYINSEDDLRVLGNGSRRCVKWKSRSNAW